MALRDVIAWSARTAARKSINALKGRYSGQNETTEEFWALRDVDFEVRRGEVLGVIGRNGAGKSTLLKILSRITEPTEGRVTIRGRVASLLEVGTGFHQELTGRENIYLNGAILGMSRTEIRRKFDEIVAFAEVEKFLDTPVKRYSSGMYVRLAFAVAAHLEPEILIVDEVLAVGDTEFQEKCLGKMRDVTSRDGRTVLFVSHNLRAVSALCTRALYLSSGSVVDSGPTAEVIGLYMHDVDTSKSPLDLGPVRAGDAIHLLSLAFTPNPCRTFNELQFTLTLDCGASARLSDLSLLIYARDGTRVAILDLRESGTLYNLRSGINTVKGLIKPLLLVAGEYNIGLYIKSRNFNGNILDLSKLVVHDFDREDGRQAYDPSNRGYLEMDYELIN